jgi:hypothetical protein
MKLEGLYVYAITNFIVYFSHYSGDQDSVIPLTGSRTLVRKLAKQLALNTTVPYRVWFEGHQVYS